MVFQYNPLLLLNFKHSDTLRRLRISIQPLVTIKQHLSSVFLYLVSVFQYNPLLLLNKVREEVE